MTKVDTGTEHLLVTIEDGVAVMTLNRPEVKNAMSGEMNAAIQKCLVDFEVDPGVKCIVLTGSGKGFCGGGDVSGMAKSESNRNARGISVDETIHNQRLGQRAVTGRLFKMPKPTIAALPGAAAGAGLCMALACDMRVMANTAIMTTAFARVGYSGDYGGSYFITQLVGTAKARELYYLSDRIDAEEALRLGLTNWVCEPKDLMDKTMEIANRLANGPTIAYRYMKENLNRALNGEMEECLDLEATHHVHCRQTDDHRDAVKAFLEKREPVFSGK